MIKEKRMNAVRSEMLVVPGGEFTMGISREKAEELVSRFFMSNASVNPSTFYTEVPERRVKLPSFYIGENEVTNEEFAEFVEDGGYSRIEYWKELIEDPDLNTDLPGKQRLKFFVDQTQKQGPALWRNGSCEPGREKHPVEGISWYEALAFARSRKMRLPRESEWELAARGTDGKTFPWGDSMDPIAEWGVRQAGVSTEVGAIKEDRSPYGLFDMARNVSEWVQDPWQPYPGSPLGELEEIDSSYGILRGGNYFSSAIEMRTTFRQRMQRLERRAGVGFRLAADVRF